MTYRTDDDGAVPFLWPEANLLPHELNHAVHSHSDLEALPVIFRFCRPGADVTSWFGCRVA